MKDSIKYTFLIATVFLFRCSDTYKWINHKEPRGYVNGIPNNFTVLDSVKTFFKSGTALLGYAFTITSDATDISEALHIDQVSGGTLMVDGNRVTSRSKVPLSKNKISVNCNFLPEIGATTTYTLLFRVQDLGGRIGHATDVTLNAFKNIPPTANFTVIKGYNGKYTFDASASRDGDTRFGGEISTFDYSITGSESRAFSTKQVVFNYGFARAGSYTVSLQLTDDDGDKSKVVTKIITVN